MTTFDPSLLTPPREEEEIYPYRRVWRSIAVETGILLTLALVLFILVNYLDFQLPAPVRTAFNLTLALTPLALWLGLSWWPERFVLQPRQRLLTVMVVSALAANAVGLPLVNNVFQVDRWLPLSSAITRIVGYTFTVGIVQEMLKYLVIRYMVWPDQFRVRLDAVAYAAASAVGYATVLNLDFVLSGAPPPDAAAIRIFGTVALQIVTSAVVGYGLAEVCFSRPSPFLLTITVALAAFMTGLAIPIRAGLVNATLSLDALGANPFLNTSAPRPLQGLGFSIALLVGPLLVLSFLFSSAEQREHEAALREV